MGKKKKNKKIEREDESPIIPINKGGGVCLAGVPGGWMTMETRKEEPGTQQTTGKTNKDRNVMTFYTYKMEYKAL